MDLAYNPRFFFPISIESVTVEHTSLDDFILSRSVVWAVGWLEISYLVLYISAIVCTGFSGVFLCQHLVSPTGCTNTKLC